MKKQLCAVLTAAVMTAFASTSVQAEYQVVQMTAAPENMLNLQITDSAGNVLDGLTATMTDSSGKLVAEWETGETTNWVFDSAIDLYSKDPDSTYDFSEPVESFTSLAAPYTIDDFNDYTDNASYAGEFEDYVRFRAGQKRTLTLLAYDPNIATVQTLGANTVGMYVDWAWGFRSAESYFQIDDQVIYLNKVNGNTDGLPLTGILDRYPVGKVTSYALPDTVFEKLYYGVNYADLKRLDTFSKDFSFKPAAREYIKYKANIKDLDWSGDMLDNWTSANGGQFTYGGNVYSLSSDSDSTEGKDYTTATLQIVSGMMVTAAVPDENGNIEFYVDKATRRFHAYLCGAWKKYDGPSAYGIGHIDGTAINEFAGYNYSIEVSAVTLPYTGDTLINVPAGSYTLSFTDGALGSNTQFIPVTVSQSQDVQYVTAVLDSANIKGDVNGDDAVNISDATLMLTHYASTAAGLPSSLTEAQLSAGDTDVDSSITIADATAILRYYAEKAAGLDPAW